ncbi:MAG: trypsin-like peptidase domain-containing protein [Hyphomicrobiales bacterium]
MAIPLLISTGCPAIAESPAAGAPSAPLAAAQDGCAAPAPVCAARGGVFSIGAYAPYGSAVRIGPDLLVTNRHVVADEKTVELTLPDGTAIPGEVLPTSYGGDLVLVKAALPEGPALVPGTVEKGGDVYTVAQDITERRVRVFEKGHVLLTPAPDRPFARLHHTAYSQPGNSGGALVNAKGELVAIATSGGEGRFEAVPATEFAELREETGADREAESGRIGRAYRECSDIVLQAIRVADRLPADIAEKMSASCEASRNRQLLDLAAQAFGRSRDFDKAIEFFQKALERDPNAINTRLSLVITLNFARRRDEALPHVRWLLDVIPEDAAVQRAAVQAGKFSGDKELAGRALKLIEQHNPQQLEAAKRFLEAPLPPALRDQQKQ